MWLKDEKDLIENILNTIKTTISHIDTLCHLNEKDLIEIEYDKVLKLIKIIKELRNDK